MPTVLTYHRIACAITIWYRFGMPILRNAVKIELSDDEVLYVVRENGNPEVILALVESRGSAKRRLSISLTLAQAMRLARALAGVADLTSSISFDTRADTDED